ncbi:MAG: hypothetical protein JWQ70_2490 [Aeromicrobium sp.]|nr:hypothetical protein [Aeromicrobium sp.]
MSLYPPPLGPQPPSRSATPPGHSWAPDPGPSVGWAVGLWIVAGLALVGSLLCGAMAAYGFSTSHHMAAEGVAATAVVTKVDRGGDVTLHFTTESGRSVTDDLVWMPFDVPKVDDKVKITYDPDDLTYVVPAGSNEDQIMGIVFIVMTGVGLLISVGTTIGAILVHRARSRNAKAPSGGLTGGLVTYSG